MNNNLILFPSMTAVLKAREILRRQGISSRVIRTPANLRRRSCGYSLLVRRSFEDAVSLIKTGKIRTVGVAAVDLS
ncbi:MAG TPA: hypothetical protein DEO32_02520 [Ruminococcaceae bacterium]|nr:hypothetical protein [Oscillospiraceae bacterium]